MSARRFAPLLFSLQIGLLAPGCVKSELTEDAGREARGGEETGGGDTGVPVRDASPRETGGGDDADPLDSGPGADADRSELGSDARPDVPADTLLTDLTPVDAAVDTPPGPGCGNGMIDAGEDCDNGPANSDTVPDACRTDCAAPHCGDNVRDRDEECDNGRANSDSMPNSCRTSCELAHCGDGVTDTVEECDDGDAVDNNVCSNACESVTAELCMPCTADSECGRSVDRCVGFAGGEWCAIACATSSDCPGGYACTDPGDGGSRQCIPSSGACAPCYDPDGDGWGIGSACAGADCDQASGSVHPGATELCDSLDNDCDGSIDEGFTLVTYWPDTDGDGHGSAAASSESGCTAPAGTALSHDDCNDSAASAYPGASEACDDIDNDCDGEADDGLARADYWVDGDRDGFGDPRTAALNRCAPLAGYATNNTDCNDGSASVNPGAAEVCDGIDNNCAGGADEGLSFSDWWPDADGDGHGAAGSSATRACAPPAGTAGNDDDCNDSAASVYAGATEACDGLDNNCDGAVDEGSTPVTYYRDADGDGYGSSSGPTSVGCSPPAGYVAGNTDCNDASSAVRPGAAESCDGLDNDCSGLPDDNGARCDFCGTVRFFSGHAYAFCARHVRWTDARDACAAVGYRLVRMDDGTENDWVRSQVAGAIPGGCSNACSWSYDDWCDDGGPSSSYDECEYGTDCWDCGDRDPPDRLWIGLNDRGTEGVWVWEGGSSSYTNWYGGEPNDSGGEDCAEIDDDDGGWNDNGCSTEHAYICEAGG